MTFLSNQMQPSQLLKTSSQHPKGETERPVCGQDFCRLGCVCSSLQQLNRGPLHCRRPECMFGCSCFKRKITKLLIPGEGEQKIEPVYCKIMLFDSGLWFFKFIYLTY